MIDALSQNITVRKVGLERWIYNLAHDQPLAYGILSLAIAIAAGWLASAVFRYLRGVSAARGLEPLAALLPPAGVFSER